MSLWTWVLLACAAAYATKLIGYLVPGRWLDHPLVTRISGTVTVALLAALVAMNTFSGDGGISFDARLGALAAAAIALMLRAPFIVVVIAGAAAAAGLRLLGLP
ncbi:AzlD domain-containing protein [Nesterenkonia alkaliphila]|uniref:AzlD domain-containing protein n=1 Tax=Nesterenkonia alkaliphila TaxID=1463631 RepID=A0A7K1UIU8_9MICC|nr:AzlD domain-containing protein [Nesterenkonia alkaliphila]MVT26336.1 AzlD domain-containing protein [Nesterenkonia alkaliphila]GFZ88467.1 branched-chain amino acid transporter AzlD [Nesterenkonia alkaliphila]